LDISVYSLPHKAAASVINDLDARFVLLLQENVLWLQIAMHQVVILLVLQRLQDLYRESADQALRYALKVVVPDKLVEID
jgi:hypothetical protein